MYIVTSISIYFFQEGAVECPKSIVRVVSPDTGLAAVQLFSPDGSPIELLLPPGIYPLSIPSDTGMSGKSCNESTVKVYGR